MPPVRSRTSTTLPRNFTFHDYPDFPLPKTPEQEEPATCRQPSPPRQRVQPRQLRVPLESTAAQRMEYLATYMPPKDVPIPTIETFFDSFQTSQPVAEPFPSFDSALLTPMQPARHATSPPKTPRAQILSDGYFKEIPDWSETRKALDKQKIRRPESAQSGFSDSSSCSNGTSLSMRSFSGSTTSPESETTDPFSDRFASISRNKGKAILAEVGSFHVTKRQRVDSKTVWNDDMDHHLWTTYLLYLQDPTVTPFRMPASGIPPLGVCHRVARQAKKSWRDLKHAQKVPSSRPRNEQRANQRIRLDEHPGLAYIGKRGSPDTLTDTRSGSVTPTATETSAVRPQWNKSESETRKRLRELCNRKSAPNPLRARMISPRSFTPFSDPQRTRLASPPVPQTRALSPGISTRDINVSLTTSTSATMHPNGVLADLARESGKDEIAPSDEWFGKPIAGRNDQPIKPLDFGLGISGHSHGNEAALLASPFHVSKRSRREPYLSRQPSFSKTYSNIQDRAPHQETTAGDLFSRPAGLSSTLKRRTLKRRALNEPEDDQNFSAGFRRSSLEQSLFQEMPESGHRRVRSRGFSLGDMSAENRFAALITPPSTVDGQSSAEFTSFPTFDEGDADVQMISPQPQRRARLGSPFAEPVTNERLLSHMNEGSNSNAFSIATFPRPHRRKYPRMVFEDAFEEPNTKSAEVVGPIGSNVQNPSIMDIFAEPAKGSVLDSPFGEDDSKWKRPHE